MNQEEIKEFNLDNFIKKDKIDKKKYIIKDDGHPNSKGSEYLHKIIYKKLSLLIN